MKVERKIPATLVVVILLTTVVKIFLPEPLNKKTVADAFWLNKTHGSTQADIVIGGDSRIYRGVSPEKMKSVLSKNLEILNLGYSSAGYSSAYLDFLKSRINPASQTKILVLGITPSSLMDISVANDEYFKYKNTGKFERWKGQHLAGMINFFIPYKADEVARMILHVKNEHIYHEDFFADGWVSSWKIPVDTNALIESHKIQYKTSKVNERHFNNLIQKIKSFQQEGITVVAFRPPSSYQMRQLEDSITGFDEECIRKTLEENGVKWMEVSESGFKSYDGSHLHYLSALRLSGILGVEIDTFFFIKK